MLELRQHGRTETVKRVHYSATMPLALAMLLAACGSSQQPAAGSDNASDAAAAPGEATADVAVVSVPSADPGTTGADAAVLTSASTIASAITHDNDVVRVETSDGWAWKRGGDVIRTASRDGRRVAYYHNGDSQPFFVQEGANAYAYQGGRPTRRFDDRGRVSHPSAAESRAAQQLADAAIAERKKGEQVRNTPSARPTGQQGRDAPDAHPTGQQGRNAPGAHPTPPAPSHQSGQPSAGGHGTPGHDAGANRNRDQPRPRSSQGSGAPDGHDASSDHHDPSKDHGSP